MTFTLRLPEDEKKYQKAIKEGKTRDIDTIPPVYEDDWFKIVKNDFPHTRKFNPEKGSNYMAILKAEKKLNNEMMAKLIVGTLDKSGLGGIREDLIVEGFLKIKVTELAEELGFDDVYENLKKNQSQPHVRHWHLIARESDPFNH
jgi:hypothetical protein